jgi:DNA-binding response OmpR family regulator
MKVRCFLKLLVLTGKGCNLNYSNLRPFFDDLTIMFSEISKVFNGTIPFDCVLVDEAYLNQVESQSSIEMLCTISNCYFILNEDTDFDVNKVFSFGAKDIFLRPLSFREIGTKINRQETPECSEILKLASYGITLKQIQIHQILKSKGANGVDRYDILKSIWNTTAVDPKNVDVQIYGLRKVLKKHNIGDIQNRNGRWYLVAQNFAA